MPVQRIHNFSLAWLLSVFAGMLLLLVVLVAVLFWRLTEGRMTMHSVTGAMSSALSIPEQGVAVKVGATKLAWGGWQSPLGVRMFDLDVTTPQGKVALPEMAIGLNLPRLFRGEVAPSLIRLERPSLQWTLGQTDVSGIDFSGWLGASAQSSGGAAIPPHLKYLKRIILNDADLRILDKAREQVVRVKQVNVLATREIREVTITVSGKVQQEQQFVPVEIAGQWRLKEQSGRVKLTLGQTPWAWATQWLPENEWTQRLEAPISGTVSVEVGGNLRPTRLEGAVALGAGTLDLGEAGPRGFTEAKLEAAWVQNTDTLEVSVMQATLASGLEIEASGRLKRLQTKPHGQVVVKAQRLGLVHELNDLLKTQMPTVQVSARGPQNETRIGRVSATVTLTPPASSEGFPEIGEVTGTVSVDSARMGLQHVVYPTLSALIADTDGEVEFTLGPGFSLQKAKATFELSGASVLSEGGDAPVDVEKLSFSADWNGTTLQTKDFRIKLDNTTRLNAQATLQTREGQPTELALSANAENVPVDRLAELWLPNLATGTRDWVVNRMSKGQVREASLELQMASGEEVGGPLQLQQLQSILQVEGTSVRYYENLPESRSTKATVEIGTDAVEIAIHSGAINELEVTAGTLRFAPLQSGASKAVFDFDAIGPLSAALTLLEHPDLAVLEKDDLPFEQASGQVRLDLGMDFPLKDELADGDFQFTAEASIDKVHLRGLPLELDLEQGALQVMANPKAVLVTGTGQVSGAMVDLEFSKPEGAFPTTQVRLAESAEVTGLVQRIAGLELEGQASGQVEISQQNLETRLVAVQVGLDSAGLVVPVVGWAKAANTPGTAKVVALVTEQGFSPELSVQLETEGFGAKGQLVLAPLGGFKSLRLSEVHGPGTQLNSLAVERQPNAGYTVALQGPQVNLAPLLEGAEAIEINGAVVFDLTSENLALSEKLSLSGKTAGTVSAAGKLEATHHGGVVYGGRTVLSEGTLEVEKSGTLPRVEGQGKSGEGDTRFSFQPRQGQPHVLEVESADAGSVLYLLTDTQAFKGGTLKLRTEFHDDNLTRHDSEVRLSNFTVTKAPVLVDILSLVSLTGLLEQLLAGGVFFDEGYGKVAVAEGRYTFKEGSAIGASTGLVFSGWLDPAKNEMDLKGSIAPAYVLTRLVRWIPVLGTILTGTDKAGLVALDFRAHGSMDDPEKDANPLSLAPGILREVFRFDWLKKPEAEQ